MRLDDKVCLVTGASSGIGAASALRLADAGATVVLVGRDAARLDAVATRVGGTSIVADLSAPDGPELVAERAGEVDVLVNNAGIGWCGPFQEMPVADLRRVVEVNLVAPLSLTRLLLPGMLERGRGHVVTVSSIAGCVGVGTEAVYAASKAAVNVFTDSLRYELAGTGVGVSVVVPGVVDTEFFTRRGVPYPRTRPRLIPPERVADAVALAVERERPEVYVPAWMRLPSRLRGAAPWVFRLGARRFGPAADRS